MKVFNGAAVALLCIGPVLFKAFVPEVGAPTTSASIVEARNYLVLLPYGTSPRIDRPGLYHACR